MIEHADAQLITRSFVTSVVAMVSFVVTMRTPSSIRAVLTWAETPPASSSAMQEEGFFHLSPSPDHECPSTP